MKLSSYPSFESLKGVTALHFCTICLNTGRIQHLDQHKRTLQKVKFKRLLREGSGERISLQFYHFCKLCSSSLTMARGFKSVWCGAVRCGVVWCGVVWCGVVWCGVVWCGVVWCGVLCCGVLCCGVVWCGVGWCGVGGVGGGRRRGEDSCLETRTPYLGCWEKTKEKS